MAVDDQQSQASSPNSTTAMLSTADVTASKDAAVIIADPVSTEDEMQEQSGWHSQRCALRVSLPEAHASIKMPAHASASPWRMMLAFAGCGTIISVGYM